MATLPVTAAEPWTLSFTRFPSLLKSRPFLTFGAYYNAPGLLSMARVASPKI